MNPEDRDYGAGAEAAHQADSVQNQMAAEAIADAPEPAPVDNSILAGIEQDEEMKSLSDIIHEGATRPDSNPTDFSAEPTQKAPKEKKSFKPILIAIIAIVVLGGAGFGVFMLISNSGSDNGGAKADPNRMAFFVEGEDGNASYAIYNDKGEKLTDAVYEKISDFNTSGYAVAKKINSDKVGIIANTGKLSVGYGKYNDIEALGENFVATNDDGAILIDGTGEKIMNADLVESKYGLFSVYDGAKSFIFDKDGVKVGESDERKPLNSIAVSQNTVCSSYDKKVRCYNAETGEKVKEFDSEEPLSLYLRSGAISDNFQCMRFESTNASNKKLYLYYYGKLSAVDEKYKDGSFGIVSHVNDKTCFFTDHKEIFVGDSEPIKIPDGSNSSRIRIRDSEHYAYISGEPGNFSLTIHMDGKERKVVENALGIPQMSGGDKHFLVSYNKPNGKNSLEMYTDSLEPVYEKEVGIMDVSFSTPIDKFGNFISGWEIINRDKGRIYYASDKTPSDSVSIVAVDDYYYVKGYVQDDGDVIFGIVDKDGKEVLEPGKYDYFKRYNDKYLVAKKGESYSLLNLDGKPIIENVGGVTVFKSHIEIFKDGKTEYYTLDANKIK